jgi:hypothetical protein
MFIVPCMYSIVLIVALFPLRQYDVGEGRG